MSNMQHDYDHFMTSFIYTNLALIFLKYIIEF